VRPKNAATVLIIRRDAKKPACLMGKRHGGHSFMPTVGVPGWADRPHDYRAPAATEMKPHVAALFDAYLPAAGAARWRRRRCRDWEETGLLLAQAAPVRPASGPWRDFTAQGALADLAAVDVIARAITPPSVGKRFDTWFLLADADRLMSLERQADCGELEEIAWVDFDEARACRCHRYADDAQRSRIADGRSLASEALHAVPPGGYAAGSSLGGRTEQYVVQVRPTDWTAATTHVATHRIDQISDHRAALAIHESSLRPVRRP